MAEGRGNRRRRGRRKRGSGAASTAQTPPVQVRPMYTPLDDPSRAYMPPPPPVREYEPDPVSGQPILNPLTAIAHPASGRPMNIETVLSMFEEQESPKEDEQIAYIGAGAFAVVQSKMDGGRSSVEIVKKLPYEDTHEKYPWRKELSPGISRDYIPQPESLDNLYTTEEIREFPRLGASTAAYMPKSS